jgi:hypothetical protein
MPDPENVAAQTEQRDTPPPAAEAAPVVASTARRQIFENITHALSDDELTNRAAVKLIIDRMTTAEAQRDEFKQFERLYYAADKKVGIQEEKLRTNKMVEIYFGTGLTLGAATAGFAPLFWDKDHKLAGIVCICYGAIQIVSSVLVRIYGPRK